MLKDHAASARTLKHAVIYAGLWHLLDQPYRKLTRQSSKLCGLRLGYASISEPQKYPSVCACLARPLSTVSRQPADRQNSRNTWRAPVTQRYKQSQQLSAGRGLLGTGAAFNWDDDGDDPTHADETIFATVYEDPKHMKGPLPSWDRNVHYIVSRDFFKTNHEKLVSCGNQFDIISNKVGALILASPHLLPVTVLS